MGERGATTEIKSGMNINGLLNQEVKLLKELRTGTSCQYYGTTLLTAKGKPSLSKKTEGNYLDKGQPIEVQSSWMLHDFGDPVGERVVAEVKCAGNSYYLPEEQAEHVWTSTCE